MSKTKTIFFVLIFNTLLNYGQTFTNTYERGARTSDGFSYNVTVQVKPISYKKESSEISFPFKLSNLSVHSKGWYVQPGYPFYSCAELDGLCNTQKFFSIDIGLSYLDDKGNTGVLYWSNSVFHHLNEELVANTYLPVGAKSIVFTGLEIRRIDEDSYIASAVLAKIKEIEKAKGSTKNTNPSSNSSTNPLLNSNKTNNATNGSVNENSNSSNQTKEESTSNINSNDPNPMTNGSSGNYQSSSSSDEFTRDMQNASTVINGIAELLGPSAEEIRSEELENERREKQEKEQARLEKADFEERNRKANEYFKSEYLDKYLTKANNGNEAARLLLIFKAITIEAGYSKKFGDRPNLSPQLLDEMQWLNEACANNNLDALNWYAWLFKNYDRLVALKHLEKAASLGSLDAMVTLGNYYDKVAIGNNAAKAFDYYSKAAELGSPIAMYYLGMIYRYGKTTDREFFTKDQIKHSVKKDPQKAFEWFSRSLAVKDQTESLYAKTIKAFYYPYTEAERYIGASIFERSVYRELEEMYKRGLGVKKDKIKAEEFSKNYWDFKDKIEYW